MHFIEYCRSAVFYSCPQINGHASIHVKLKVWIWTIHGLPAQSIDPYFERDCIEHAQSTDWGNPWIGVLIKGWYPLWLNRGGGGGGDY